MKTKYKIPQKLLWQALERSKKLQTVGVDGQTMRDFRKNQRIRIRTLWKQLSTGQYKPSPLLQGYRRKPTGGWRAIGIPTVKDHLVQTMLRERLSSLFKTRWHPDSFLHFRGIKARRMALESVKKRCLRYNWALIIDVKQYGDHINHKLLMEMLKKHFKNPWILFYTGRMLKAPTRLKNGTILKRNIGIPHDDSLSYFLADFYMHEVFDQWMKKNHPSIPFERYIDDIIIHCDSEAKARALLSQILKRFSRYKLRRNEKKTKIVYCKDGNRKGTYKNISFRFLEYTFRSRKKQFGYK